VKNNLAHIYQIEKRYAEAEPLYRSAVAGFERDGRTEDPRLAPILANYSALLRAMGDYAKAEKIQARATSVEVGNALRRERNAS